jgi:phosphoenolpyruvate carboxylase
MPTSLQTQETAETLDSIDWGFRQIDQDIRWLSDALVEVLSGLGEAELARWIPWTSAALPNASSEVEPPARLGLALAMAFQLLNTVEEQVSETLRDRREESGSPEAERGLWADQLAELVRAGATAESILEALRGVEVEPVFTAHPTEAKRSSVLEQHRLLMHLLQAAAQPGSRRARRAELIALLERLWRTGEILIEKPTVADERRNVLNYLRDVLPGVVPELDRRLREAWERAGLSASSLEIGPGVPALRFGTWVGGDRDGHPGVTAEVTAETLERLRANALVVLHRELGALAERLPLSEWIQPAPPSLCALRDRSVESLGDAARPILRMHPGEPWRQTVELMAARLPVEVHPGQLARVLDEPGRYRQPGELDADLQTLETSLVEAGAGRLAAHDVAPVRRVLATVGFHLAHLDVRQNSAFHDRALRQLLCAAGIDATQWDEWTETERLRLLEREIRSPRPFLHPSASAGPEADAVLATYRVLAEHLKARGVDGLGALIVSMTRRLSDLLGVYVLAREAGLLRLYPEGMVCLLPVVPLLETVEDLERGPEMLRAFLEFPVTRASLAHHAIRAGRPGRLRQQVMVGYSDSNKDAGIVASQWALQRGQARLAKVGEQSGVQVQFFHGRGGTISRGAGPTHRFLEALPPGSLAGAIRLTEQGETIAQKYGNPGTARYNLELLLAGVTATTWRHRRKGEFPAELVPLMDRLAAESSREYRSLLEAEGFLTFHRQATPLDALENTRIGSRPSRRTGQASLTDLRAIPWVFSWTQARFYLTGWYGAGSALSALSEQEASLLRDQVRSVPFLRYLITNIETSLASSDLEVMREYASLVEEPELRDRIWGRIEAEWHRTQRSLASILGTEFARHRPRLGRTLALRVGPLRTLHRQQISLLRQWRASIKAGDTEAAQARLPDLLLTINAIASGLRTTG